MVEKGKNSVVEQISRRLLPGEHKQPEKREYLFVRQAVAFHFRFEEARQQIALRRFSPLTDALHQVGAHLNGYAVEIAQRLLRLVASTPGERDRKSTRLNSSHTVISYAVFC